MNMNNLRLPAPRTSSPSPSPSSFYSNTSTARLRTIDSDNYSSNSGSDGSGTGGSKDFIVQQTDQDASLSRLSAVSTGYLQDDFAQAFCAQKEVRRFPLINRGTFVRTTALDRIVNTFLCSPPPSTPPLPPPPDGGRAEVGGRKQVVSLGAGSDTRFFRLRQSLPPHTLANLVYHEIDFAVVTAPKIAAIMRNRFLAAEEAAGAVVDEAAGSLALPSSASASYYIHPLDLRTLKPDCQVPLTGVETDIPTLFLSECCLIYLSPEEADGILRWVTTAFTGDVGIALYEPIGGEDAFGKVMIQNLAARGIVLKTLKKYSSLERQKARLRALGFASGQDAADVYFASEHWVADAEKERIGRLEMLDEVEEWRMLARHYCVAWGWRGDAFAAWRDAFPLQRE